MRAWTSPAGRGWEAGGGHQTGPDGIHPDLPGGGGGRVGRAGGRAGLQAQSSTLIGRVPADTVL